MDIIQAIDDYILYLRRKANLRVTLHPMVAEPVIAPTALLRFNIHEPPYCIYLKTHPQAHRHCVERQGKILERCRGGSFCGTCFAGVREFVYPISGNGKLLGFISVSGYRAEHEASYLERVARDYDIPEDLLRSAYETLRPVLPPKEEIDTLLHPLCAMLELAYSQKAAPVTGAADLMVQILWYLHIHHTERITSQELCRVFSCSRSYLAHTFKARTGQSLPEYLNALRMEDARHLLADSTLDIAEIAYAVGFEDRNYFTLQFRKATGCSPRAYRQNVKNAPP